MVEVKRGKTGRTGKRGPSGKISEETVERLARIETLCSGEAEWRDHIDGRFDGMGKALIDIHTKINDAITTAAYQKSLMEQSVRRLDLLDNLDTGAVIRLQQEVKGLSTIAKAWSSAAGILSLIIGFFARYFFPTH